MISIGLRIKNIRMGLGLTVDSLSHDLGVSRTYLTLIENGERRLPKKLVGKLAKAFIMPKATVYEWYLEQELRGAGITDKKSHELIKKVLKMTPKEKESLLQVLKEHKIHQKSHSDSNKENQNTPLLTAKMVVESAPARINIEDDRLVFKTGKPKEIIKQMTGADGKKYWFEAIKVPQFDDKGRVIGLIGIARDITKRKRAVKDEKISPHRSRR